MNDICRIAYESVVYLISYH